MRQLLPLYRIQSKVSIQTFHDLLGWQQATHVGYDLVPQMTKIIDNGTKGFSMTVIGERA
jgi:hypothetical protein